MENAFRVLDTRFDKVSEAIHENTNEMNTALTTLIDLSFQLKTDRTLWLLKNLTTREMIMKIFELLEDPVKYQMLNKRFYNVICPHWFRQIERIIRL